MYEEFGFINFYMVLGVGLRAPEAEIKKVFQNLARIYHPDKSGSKETTEKFKLICHAYNILKNPEKRVRHDRDLLARHRAEYRDHNGNRHHNQSQKQHHQSPDSSYLNKWFNWSNWLPVVAFFSILKQVMKYCQRNMFMVKTYSWLFPQFVLPLLLELLHAAVKYSRILIPIVAKLSLRTLFLLAKGIVTTLARYLSSRSIVKNLVISGHVMQILILGYWMGILPLFGWIIIRFIHIALFIVLICVKLFLNILLYMTGF